ncbi:hypothetical protein [Kocuria sp. ZOR0020]|uniref:hypothetical protein n=1 Tax=Kocuria sp. ZOR0020 TaxID=1339234 RepID=UPI0018CF3ACD|nr:hypothetical protein [Kocuria sp. ZOR0020]
MTSHPDRMGACLETPALSQFSRRGLLKGLGLGLGVAAGATLSACASSNSDGAAGASPGQSSPSPQPVAVATTDTYTVGDPVVVKYGTESQRQYGQLWIPQPLPTSAPVAVVMMIHGGGWMATSNLNYM